MRNKNGKITTEKLKETAGDVCKSILQYNGNELQDFYNMYLPKRQTRTSLSQYFIEKHPGVMAQVCKIWL